VGVVLGFIEIVVFLTLSIVLVIKAGHHNTLAVFTTNYANAKGLLGMTGVIAGAVGALLAFSGFEAAAPLAEETRNPRRNVPRAVLLSTILIGALYIFTTYAADVSYGPAVLNGFAASANGVPWDGLARTSRWSSGRSCCSPSSTPPWPTPTPAPTCSRARRMPSGGSARSRACWPICTRASRARGSAFWSSWS
jgi:hypothetical protein